MDRSRFRPNLRKLSPLFATQLELAPSEDKFPVIVTFQTESQRAKLLALGLGAEHRFKLLPACTMALARGEIGELSHRPEVAAIWPDAQVKTCLDVSVPLIGAPLLWREGYTGRNVKIAVVDTGIDGGHPDLKGRVIGTKDITGEGFFDYNGHGTHVAGIAAGAGSRYSGVAREALLLGVKALKGNGIGMMSWVMAGVEWAVENGAQVINLSLGASGPCDGSDPLSALCDAAVDRGLAVCAAAGNQGPTPGSIGSPGCARRVITVGASTDDDQVADFSARGPTVDGRTKPDMVFPGYGIVSCRARGTYLGKVVDELYTEASGTSMATPHASGAAALLLEANPRLTPWQVKFLLTQTAQSLGLPPNTQGKGRARLDQAYRRSLEPLPAPPPELPPGIPPPESIGCLLGLLPWRRRQVPSREPELGRRAP